MSSPVQVPATTRLRLAHGCLDHLARRADVRVLHLKGAALDPSLAEGRAPSTDCDVLVEPHRAQQFCDVLAAHGWRRVTSFAHGSVFGHAARDTMGRVRLRTVRVTRDHPGPLPGRPAVAWEGRPQWWSVRPAHLPRR